MSRGRPGDRAGLFWFVGVVTWLFVLAGLCSELSKPEPVQLKRKLFLLKLFFPFSRQRKNTIDGEPPFLDQAANRRHLTQ
jgi:hypothetical protein